MSTENIFDAEEQQFVRLVDKFYLALSLTKVCSTSCHLLKSDMTTNILTTKERDCIKICVDNIQKSQSAFIAKTKLALNLPTVGSDNEEGGNAPQ